MDMSLSKHWEMVKDREAWHGPWGRKESDTIEQLNINNVKYNTSAISRFTEGQICYSYCKFVIQKSNFM